MRILLSVLAPTERSQVESRAVEFKDPPTRTAAGYPCCNAACTQRDLINRPTLERQPTGGSNAPEDREDRRGVAPRAHPRAVRDPAPPGHRAALHRQVRLRQGQRNVQVRRVRSGPLQLGTEV